MPVIAGIMKLAKSTYFTTGAGDRTAVRRLLERLRGHRFRRNWTQAELASRAGMGRTAYQDFENGYGNITLANLVRILGVLGFSTRLTDLVPPLEEERTLESGVRPPRQRVRAVKLVRKKNKP